jgi:hypothetical protein
VFSWAVGSREKSGHQRGNAQVEHQQKTNEEPSLWWESGQKELRTVAVSLLPHAEVLLLLEHSLELPLDVARGSLQGL